MTDRVIIEADGGSRGNPGPASYGALIRDADTGQVIDARGETIGFATNNVAEYRGLIAGLELAREHAPEAELEVRMDSKLVIEQMAGRWKVKHVDMKPLAARAQGLLPPSVTWTWVPREQNKAADALANAALDDQAAGGSGLVTGHAPDSAAKTTKVAATPTGWGAARGEPTTIILLRHGVTESTERRVFSGAGGSDPGLTETGAEQAGRAAAWLERRGGIDAIVSSPMQRTRQTAEIVAGVLGLDVEIDDGLMETAFGDWDGYTFGEIQERWPSELAAWLGSTAVAPPGGEAFDDVDARITVARERIVQTYAGKTVVAVSHVTPIKLLLRQALDAPMSLIYRMELDAASITTIAWWPDGAASVRNFNVVPE
ncbi:MAG: bifunctional RNase H/acid phosphatase [Aeromicrobium sp.]|nr:bifunctional RNase H/acid phosphatase [Aeromicrobium sp.]